MKRMVNDVPLSAVLSLMPGFSRVVIEDRRECNRYMDNAPDTRRWDGLVKDVYKAGDEITYKWMRTKVREIRPLAGGATLFVICTEYEQY